MSHFENTNGRSIARLRPGRELSDIKPIELVSQHRLFQSVLTAQARRILLKHLSQVILILGILYRAKGALKRWIKTSKRNKA